MSRANGVALVPIAIWAGVADAMEVMMAAGLGHLLTEDVLRFELIRVLIDAGVSPEHLRKEVRIDEVGSIDLEVLGRWESAIELKFPRDPQGGGAADTMTLGELLKDFFKVAHSGRSNAVVLQLTDSRLRRYLARRISPEPEWTFEPGDTMNLTPESVVALPKAARGSVGPLFERGTVRARCVFAADVGDWKLVAYEVHVVKR